MTLDAAEVNQVTEIAARVAAEVTRNAVRGTGGATLPLPVLKIGTVGGTAGAGAEVSVRADGDTVAVPAINATGFVLEAGDRVVIEWRSPSGVFVTGQLARAQRGNWTPTIAGPSSNGANQSGAGHYTRIGHRVHAYAKWTLGSGGSFGTAPTFGELPFPVISDGDGIIAQFQAIYNDVSVPRFHPCQWLLSEGTTRGQVFGINAFGGAATLLSPVSDTFPVTVAAGDQLLFFAHYDTDAA